MSARTASGVLKFRPVRPGGRVALVAPASPFDRAEFDAGIAELARLGLHGVYDESVFARSGFTAGAPASRGEALMRAFDVLDADAVMAVRGGYGSVELLAGLDADRVRQSRRPFIGYSDVTSVHSWLGAVVGVASVHGPMLDGRLAKGPVAYDPLTFLRALDVEPLGDLTADGLEALQAGAASGPLVGGTLTQLLASLETPFAFRPPAGHVLFLDEINERPYRLHRMLTQWRLSGRLQAAAAIVFGQLPRCDEPGGAVTARDVLRDVLAGFPGPILFGFPSGHTTTPLLTLPFGVRARVDGDRARPRLVIEEAAAAA